MATIREVVLKHHKKSDGTYNVNFAASFVLPFKI